MWSWRGILRQFAVVIEDHELDGIIENELAFSHFSDDRLMQNALQSLVLEHCQNLIRFACIKNHVEKIKLKSGTQPICLPGIRMCSNEEKP